MKYITNSNIPLVYYYKYITRKVEEWESILLLVIYFKYITKSILLRRESSLTYLFQNIPWETIFFLTRDKLRTVSGTLPRKDI